jgi:polyisoprenoid-binding protein YceI
MRYVVQPRQSRFTVQAVATGMLSSMAHSPTFAVRDFTGELHFDPEAPRDAAFDMTVKAHSLSLTDNLSAHDRSEIEGRMREEVLNTAAYPEIIYHATVVSADKIAENWYRLQLSGELRLHGVKRPQQVDAQLRLAESEARLSGRCSVSQSAYTIKPVSALGGLIKVKDELKLDFDMVCSKQEA